MLSAMVSNNLMCVCVCAACQPYHSVLTPRQDSPASWSSRTSEQLEHWMC